MPCAESLRVQAYFDGETDALSAADIERHMEQCAICRAQLEHLEQLRAALRVESTYESTPAALRARVMRALDEESKVPSHGTKSRRVAKWRPQPFWKGALSGVGATAIAASLAYFMLAPTLTSPLLDDIVSAHVRSLMPDHLIDVVSTDKHTVKPWFAGHTDVSPVVADFAAQGYRLMGGRADYFDHQRPAVVVYQHGSHIINVFSWAVRTDSVPKNTTRNGYHLVFWKSGDLMYCAVSDTAWDELRGLAQLLQDLVARDSQ